MNEPKAKSFPQEPTFDANGYPTDETLETIKVWAYPFCGLITYVRKAWHSNGVIRQEADGCTAFVTGGWSGNEELLGALKANHSFWSMYWESSHVGGKVCFRLPFGL